MASAADTHLKHIVGVKAFCHQGADLDFLFNAPGVGDFCAESILHSKQVSWQYLSSVLVAD